MSTMRSSSNRYGGRRQIQSNFRRLGFVVFLVFAVLPPATCAVITPAELGDTALGAEPRPDMRLQERGMRNLVLIIADDFREDGPTVSPALDMLRRRPGAVSFENLHVTKSECAPSRLALLAGRRPDATRTWGFAEQFRDRNPALVTFPGRLKQLGMRTVSLGKVFDDRNFKGADENEDLCKQNGTRECSWNDVIDLSHRAQQLCDVHKSRIERWPKGGHGDPKGIYRLEDESAALARNSDVCIAKAATRLIVKLAGGSQPFLLAVGLTATHLPFVAPSFAFKTYDMVSDADLLAGSTGKKTQKYSGSDEPKGSTFWGEQSSNFTNSFSRELRQYDWKDSSAADRRRAYFAAATFTDDLVGHVLRALDALPAAIRDNIVVAFWSDHGFHLGEHGLWCKKTNLDAATAAPFVVVPAKRDIGRNGNGLGLSAVPATIRSPAQELDVFPTLLDLLGFSGSADAEGQKRAGTSLLPAMRNPEVDFPRAAALSQYWAHGDSEDKKDVMGYSFRSVRYRFIVYLRFKKYPPGGGLQYKLQTGAVGRVELYDYKLDGPFERVNHAENPEYATVIDQFWRLANNNQDRDWTSLLGKTPFDANELNSIENTTNAPMKDPTSDARKDNNYDDNDDSDDDSKDLGAGVKVLGQSADGE